MGSTSPLTKGNEEERDDQLQTFLIQKWKLALYIRDGGLLHTHTPSHFVLHNVRLVFLKA